MDLHIHSNFSDGTNAPEEIVESAINLGYNIIGITDHVRRDSLWVESFVTELGRLKDKHNNEIKILCCIEAKVIDTEGNIDAQAKWFPLVDLVFAAFHAIPTDNGFMTEGEIVNNHRIALNFWFQGMLRVLKNPLVHVIAHPEAILKNYNIRIPRNIKEEIAVAARISPKIFEINGKYNVPDAEFLDLLKTNKVKLIFGSDSHSVVELAKFRELSEKVSKEIELKWVKSTF